MRDSIAREHCVLCGVEAAVRVSGTSFCAPCGLKSYSTGASAAMPSPRRRQRFALLGLLSSGFLAKLLLGAVAVAAVGGVTASAVRHSDEPVAAVEVMAPETQAPETQAPETVAPTTTAEDVESGIIAVPETTSTPVADDEEVRVSSAREYASAVQIWADCVSREASLHSGGAFDPLEACPGKPNPHDFGLDVPVPPGHDDDGPGNSGNAPGQSDDDAPGNSGNAPGQSDDDGSGNSGNAPGQNKEAKADKEAKPDPGAQTDG